jgi:hypothetical protein
MSHNFFRLYRRGALTALVAAACAFGSACSSESEDSPSTPAVTGKPEEAQFDPTKDRLPPGRLYRRLLLSLRGTPPTDAELDTLFKTGDDEAQYAFIKNSVDPLLQDKAFYTEMVEFAKHWMHLPAIPPSADEPEFGAAQQLALNQCPAGTKNAGAWRKSNLNNNPDETRPECMLKNACESDRVLVIDNPWWSPGKAVRLTASAASIDATGDACNPNPTTKFSCLESAAGSCGCGPNGVLCVPQRGGYETWESYLLGNPTGARRQLWEEPSRLLAHLAWFDRPATDLLLGSYSVGTTTVQAAYIMKGVTGGKPEVLNSKAWWEPSQFDTMNVDPLHDRADPQSWREFSVASRNPFMLSERNYTFDPRTQTGPARGIPAAGVLTSLNFLIALPRERLRAARALETFACEALVPPPASAKFNEFKKDPATEGTCQHCHRRIDPAAIHFKRFSKFGWAYSGIGATYEMPGIGRWVYPKAWIQPDYGDPNLTSYFHFRRWYTPDTQMTPITKAQDDEDPMRRFIDFLPPNQTLLGQTSDGTIGPLGFAKMIVGSGAFDKCFVRRMHERIVGRDIDAETESGYLDTLVTEFVKNNRTIRPLVRTLVTTQTFQRGL